MKSQLLELIPGMGRDLLRRACPEGAIIAELQDHVEAGVQTVEIVLTSAQLKALTTVPVALLPAPGGAQWYELTGYAGLFFPGSDTGSDPLTGDATTMAFCYGDPTNPSLLFFDLQSASFDGSSGRLLYGFNFVPFGLLDQVLGQPILLNNGGAAYTGNGAGDARLSIRLSYRLRTLPAASHGGH